MFNLGFLVRAALLIGTVASSCFGVIAVTAPSRLAEALRMTDADPLKAGTAFGVALLTLVTFFLLRPRGGIAYLHVRHHEPDAVRRPVPQNVRPKVAKKVRAKVRAAAAQHVKAQRRAR